MANDGAPTKAAATGGFVLLTLATGQFVMTLDSSVMNVSIATVASDIGTTVTGIQTAITLYTLVMACLMIVGGKIGSIIGRRRAFSIGCVIYGAGSLTTALAPNLFVLILGWSFLEGIGAALIMPAIVGLVASNFARTERPRAYGLVAAAGAMAVAVGPLIGGLVTTYFSWRYVFVGEVVIIIGILFMARRVQDEQAAQQPRLDFIGAFLSATGLALGIYGVLRSSEWGWVAPKAGGPSWLGLSPTIWLILAGSFILWIFFRWQTRLEREGKAPLVETALFGNHQLTGGLTTFFFQYLLQSGIFFIIPLFLSIVLGLSALETGVRILPLSVGLLLTAAGVPKVLPNASPRRVARAGLLLILAGILGLLAGIDLDANAAVVSVPLMLIGLGIGSLASQLGAVTVSAVPDEKSPEVGGLQNTATNLGASLGTALAGSVLIAVLSASFISGIQQNPTVPESVKTQASVELAGGAPFLSDADLQQAMEAAGASEQVTQAALDENEKARIDGLHAALAILALIACAALFFTQRIPGLPVAAAVSTAPADAP
ncbi:putative transport protein HsrA [Arthrobacter sp. SO5]|uniref:MFS transporter n=1 Tax=Arthrobacter sp. SO5 TaxID=1897055 RepID=UPI001E5F50A5|nr:MFS transporter [Arthrobacter sp. SO5]MCB5275325.1 putative transport protein HsrA [Arthrobacter sp. SO5]